MNETKKIKNRIKLITFMPIVLALVLMTISIGFLGVESTEGLVSISLIAVFVIVVILVYLKTGPKLDEAFVEYAHEQGKIQKELLQHMDVPYALLDRSGHVMWANDRFHDTVGVDRRRKLKHTVDAYFPELTKEVIENTDDVSVELEFDSRLYNAEIIHIDMAGAFSDTDTEDSAEDMVIAIYLFDITELRSYQQQAVDQKLYAGLVYIDNYDEVMDSVEDIKHSILTALVDRKITMYLSNIDAIVKHIENDKYFFVFKQKFMQTLREDKFSLLDDVKNINIGNDISMTLSIGVGTDSDIEGNSFMQAYENARMAIGMALGRGGDQAAVKVGDQVTYYGGKSAGTEKATRVKARVKAQAFEELLQNKDKVIIMAHKRPDSDAFGSAIGIYRMVTTLGKKAYIVLNEVTDAIKPIYATFKVGNTYDDVFIKSDEAVAKVDQSTLLVVCDVNRPSMTECEELLSLAPAVVVFDHHRQTNEAITGATLSYIEPFASSACEMIAEMYQYMRKPPKLKTQEADAMYAGILIDTDNFLTKTGVRTFEAASYLRKCGADVTRVRKMFRSTMTEMKERAEGISNAEIYMDTFALSYVDANPESQDAPTVPVAKVANELLNVVNVKASFVVTEADDGILYVSARSVGDVNVQLVMEKWGGGGHANVAGVQLKGKSKEEFFKELRETLAKMHSEGEI